MWKENFPGRREADRRKTLCLCVKERFTSKQFLFSCFLFLFLRSPWLPACACWLAFFDESKIHWRHFYFWVNRLMPLPRVESSSASESSSIHWVAVCLTSDLSARWLCQSLIGGKVRCWVVWTHENRLHTWMKKTSCLCKLIKEKNCWLLTQSFDKSFHKTNIYIENILKPARRLIMEIFNLVIKFFCSINKSAAPTDWKALFVWHRANNIC